METGRIARFLLEFLTLWRYPSGAVQADAPMAEVGGDGPQALPARRGRASIRAPAQARRSDTAGIAFPAFVRAGLRHALRSHKYPSFTLWDPNAVMENVVLIVHLILALCLIGVVLLQRSEGGGLGLGGGGGGGGGLVSSRSAATALGKVTWLFAIAFICTSLTLTIIAAQKATNSSVLDQIGIDVPGSADGEPGALPSGDALLPPTPGGASGGGGGLDLPRVD